MSKALCWGGMVLSLLVFLFFVLDLSIGIPFGRKDVLLDVVFVVVALLTAFLGWRSLRSIK